KRARRSGGASRALPGHRLNRLRERRRTAAADTETWAARLLVPGCSARVRRIFVLSRQGPSHSYRRSAWADPFDGSDVSLGRFVVGGDVG
ncbi:MAG: hypothetical protein M3T56_15940, partial [Chloroflexota bacterium]|nr:hypothetical protein [Chloroflexota bacterium]